MPSIVDSSTPVTYFPNLFISPFGNDGVIPLYSSIPLTNPPSGTCLPCVMCGNSTTRQQVLEQEANALQPSLSNGINVALTS